MPAYLPSGAVRAAGRKLTKYHPGNQALMGVVDGAAKLTGQLAGAVERVTDYSKKTARKDDEPAPSKEDNSWSGVAKRTFRLLTDGDEAQRKALENHREHHRQVAPAVNKINTEAKKIRQDTEHHSGDIRIKLGAVGKTVSKATEMLPEVMTAGASTRAKIANNATGAVKDYGEHKSIPGALAKLAFGGNSKLSNVASNLTADALAEARKKISYGSK